MFYPVTVEYMFCSCALRTHAKISNTLSYKTKFNKFERTEVIQCVFSDYNGIKLGINNKEHWKCVAQHTSTGWAHTIQKLWNLNSAILQNVNICMYGHDALSEKLRTWPHVTGHSQNANALKYYTKLFSKCKRSKFLMKYLKNIPKKS